MTQFAIKNLIRYSPQITVVNIKSSKYLALICAGVGASRHLFEPKPKQWKAAWTVQTKDTDLLSRNFWYKKTNLVSKQNYTN